MKDTAALLGWMILGTKAVMLIVGVALIALGVYVFWKTL